ncbi:3'-5' exonuclease [Candidatus Trichorickettsia mobilis]|uniref:3'-5' exonuclease n=1 Tax=Candidatus Trichorickettsia mobilis TaxID=1346319 RepID=UPI002930197E|nr:3'-5' exonuclease [Candidatus Trichorickettsia mobilis]
MKLKDLKKMAAILSQSNQYRVTEKYQRPEFYNIGDSDPKLIGVFLDIEATGLSSAQDKLIELGMVKFEYSENGRIFRLLDEFSRYQDPHMSIPEYISKLTGITDDMVNGHQINEHEAASYLQEVDIIIAHNAQFDRTFFEMTFPAIPPKAWGCSMCDIDWKIEGISSHKLEYIAYKYNFFYEGHRAVIDSLAGIHILAQDLPNSKQPVLKQLLANALQLKFKLWATDSPYDSKDLLRARGYRWSNHPTTNYKSWSIELAEDKVAEEIDYLRSNIYGGSTLNMPVEIVDAYSRFSNNYKHLQNATKYQDKIEWIKMLCLK